MPSDNGTTSSNKHVPSAAVEDVRLNRRPEGDDFVRVQFRVWRRPKNSADPLADVGNSRRAADQNDFVDRGRRQAGVAAGRERHLSRVRSMNG